MPGAIRRNCHNSGDVIGVMALVIQSHAAHIKRKVLPFGSAARNRYVHGPAGDAWAAFREDSGDRHCAAGGDGSGSCENTHSSARRCIWTERSGSAGSGGGAIPGHSTSYKSWLTVASSFAVVPTAMLAGAVVILTVSVGVLLLPPPQAALPIAQNATRRLQNIPPSHSRPPFAANFATRPRRSCDRETGLVADCVDAAIGQNQASHKNRLVSHRLHTPVS